MSLLHDHMTRTALKNLLILQMYYMANKLSIFSLPFQMYKAYESGINY